MATSGITTYDPSAAGLTLTAFGRIGIRRTEITIQHLQDAATEANLVQVGIANGQPTLWRSEIYPITLTAGTAEYSLPSRMVAIQDVYISAVSSGSTVSIDRLLAPLSLLEYDSQPNKTQQAPPVSYLIQKTLSPTITFWQTPDDSSTYTANVRLLSRPETVVMSSGTTLDLPYIYLDVFVAGLAHRLARIYAPDKEMIRRQDYLDALAIAQNTDTQDSVSLYIQPIFSGYSR